MSDTYTITINIFIIFKRMQVLFDELKEDEE